MSKSATELIERLKSRQACIGVIGLGYVGLPLILRYAEVGFNVIGFDTDVSKIEFLRRGVSYIKHLDAARVDALTQSGRMSFSEDMALVQQVDAVILCVPTPLMAHREPDLSFITQTMDALAPYLRKGQAVSLESTTYPGTTEEELRPRIEAQGLNVGSDVFLVYSPEREDPGNQKYSTQSIPKLVAGSTPSCAQVAAALYEAVVDTVVPVSTTRTAEMAKLLENIHRAVNIGLVNEMKVVADRMCIDIHEVIDAAATKPFGFVPYYPGPGLGGHCIPIDPFYLTWKAREYNVHTRFIELAGEVNSSMPDWVLGKISEALNTRSKAIRGSTILILGIAYKKNIDDMRESPSVALMELLRMRGANIQYADPWVPVFPKMRKHSFDLSSVELNAEVLSQADCVVVATEHDAFDWDLVARHAQLVVDTRGIYRDQNEKIFKA